MEPERKWGYWVLLIVFLALLLIGALETWLKAETPGVLEQIGKRVERALTYHDGIVISWDLQSGNQKIWGNRKLLDHPFLPGSTMKLVTAEAALAAGLNPQYHCDGQEDLPGGRQFCWTPQGHGQLRLPEALAHSCNLYFSQLGQTLGTEALLNTLSQYSFRGLSPLKPAQLKIRAFAIGEDPAFQVSPRQMAGFWRGYLKKLEQPQMQGIRQGLLKAASEGTALRSGRNLLGKTGTADSLSQAFPTHGWFLGAYPSKNPRRAFVIFMKNAHGYREPASLAGEMVKIWDEHRR
ncbi:MAG: penicillin-binding transpeptidase domain-containing protein [bacterium]|nr:penicillin-binding transpeptidase domain-containing protein [bacterium]